jgi:hypothetical protein
MKKLILATSMLFLSLYLSYGQEGKWDYARLFQSVGAIATDSWGMDICMDANDNVYIMGVFRAVPLTIGTTTLTNRGNYDIFLCSFDAQGNFRWAQSIGSTGNDDIAGIVIDGNNLYVAGAYNAAAVYFTPTQSLPNSGNYDSFIARYSTIDGSFLGARRVFWGTTNQRLQDMTLDNFNDYLVVVGQFTSQLIYNNGVQDTTITPSGTKDFIIARFDLSGGFDNLQFHDLKRFYSNASGTSLKQVNLSVIGSNHTGYFLSGDLYGTLWFPPSQSIVGKSTTTSDALVIKLDNNLNYVWARRGGGTAYDHVNSSISDDNGNIYLAGKLEGQNGTFDSTATQQSRVIKSVGAMDFHITKYNREGRLLWLYHIGYAGNDDAFGMALQGNYLQVAGNMSDEGNTNTGFFKLDLAGNYINQGEIHGDGEDVGKGVAFDSKGFTLITGYSNSATLYFGSRTDPDTILVNTSGTYDAFLGKYQYPLTIVKEEVKDVSCNGANDGYIRLRGEFGAGGYIWSWEHETNPTPVADSLIAGTYIVTLTDEDANIVKDTIVISEPTKILINRAITNVSCFNGSNGVINITPAGGTPGTPPSYAYFWSGGSGLNPTGQNQTGLSAGSYNVRVTDDNGCWLDSTFNVTQPARLVIDNLKKWDVSPCSSSNGSAKVYASGGTAIYSYLWSNGKTTDSINSLAHGDYSVKITDANGCSVTSEIITIIDSCEVNLIVDNVKNVSCNGGSDGSIVMTTFGGDSPYTYFWTPDVGHNDSIATGLSAGNYQVIVRDNSGDRDTIKNIVITQPTPLFASAVLVDVICYGESSGRINQTVSGGTPPYTHKWWPICCAITEDLTNIPFGEYTDTISDANGCQLVKIYTIIQNPEIKVTDPNIDSVSCIGLNDGAINITVGGGVSPYSYYWLEKNWDPKDGLTTQDIEDLFAGEYSVKITDNLGCFKMYDTIVSQPDLISLVVDSIKPSCPGRVDGAAWIHAIGGNGGYTYIWTPTGKTGNHVENMPAWLYNVNIVDKKQCQGSGQVSITESPAIIITLDSIKHILCPDGCGSIYVSVDNGTPPYTYLWSPVSDISEDLVCMAADTYNIIVTDAANCPEISEDFIIEDQSVPLDIIRQEVVANVSCHGSANGEIILKATGKEPISYSIDNGATWQTDTLFTGLQVGSYITAFKDGNECIKYDSTLIVTEPAPLQIEAVVTDVTCSGDSSGTITISISGGTPSYSCSWSDGPTECDRDSLTAGSYILTITDGNGCSKDTNFIISEPSSITVNGIVTDVSCNGGSDGVIATSISGGISPYTCLWDNGPTTCDRTNLPADSFKLTVTDGNGCIKDTTFIIYQPGVLNINSVDTSWNSTSGGTITISASGGTNPLTYGLIGVTNAGDSDSNLTGAFIDLLGGEYKVYVVDNNLCTDTADKTKFPELCCLSVESLFDNSNISLYPNPTTGKLTVEIEARDSKDIYLEIVNLLGQVIWKKELQNNGQLRFVEVIDMSQQSKGTYFMRVNGLPVHTKILLE